MQPDIPVDEPAVIALARTALARGVAALAAQDKAAALRWLERAHRLVPYDPNATLALASACLATDPNRAATLFTGVVKDHDVRQAWLGLAAANLRLRAPQAATAALSVALGRHAFAPDTLALVRRIETGPGWCGLRSDGTLELHPLIPGRVEVVLDGERLATNQLPAGWAKSAAIRVRFGDADLLGSPIQPAAIRRLAGCVEVWQGGLRGWAWHPGDPETLPMLTLTYASNGARQTLIARDESITVPATGPLARPRSFHLVRDALLAVEGLIHLRGPDGRDLPGSPLNPFDAPAAPVAAVFRLTHEPVPVVPGCAPLDGNTSVVPRTGGPTPSVSGVEVQRRAATVIICVHDRDPNMLPCLRRVLGSLPPDTPVLVIDDGSSDAALVASLDDLARLGKISLLRHRRALGFPASANAGIYAAGGHDVVLLDSHTLVPPHWLERLRDAAYGAPDIGSVTPLSNDAGLLSYPGPAGTNRRPDQTETARLDRLAMRANGQATVDIPMGVGFCLYLRRDCLNAVGVFRADVFAQGHGEENDLCLRAARLGWRNVALTGLFVGHIADMTFGDSAVHLRARNDRLLEQLHPGHDALIARFGADDPLATSRRQIDLLAWKQDEWRWHQAAILITHNAGGGVEHRLAQAAKAHAEAGRRPIILRPAEAAHNKPAIAISEGASNHFPNLIFAVPRELPALLRLLRAANPKRMEVHHLADYPPGIYDLITLLGLRYDVHVHDYAWLCPRIALVAREGRYCGEPDLATCETCIIDNGHLLKFDIGVGALRRRSATFLGKALRVIVPADDVRMRLQRYFPDLSAVVVPHQDDHASRRTVKYPMASGVGHRGRSLVCVVGAIGVHKGYDVLLACARDAARRDLDLEFVIVGHTIDDAGLMDTGRAFVTGRFEDQEAIALIAAQYADYGFVSSICPETWCLGLGQLWGAGLPVAAFDIGAPAERIRRMGHGFVLPLSLPANAVNDMLIAAIQGG